VPSKKVELAESMSAGYDVVLTQGFIARTPKGDTCLLGRGGSDTSSSLFGALIGAAAVEISVTIFTIHAFL
jgi:diaminopimelate decarboxylase/aspartate kinase